MDNSNKSKKSEKNNLSQYQLNASDQKKVKGGFGNFAAMLNDYIRCEMDRAFSGWWSTGNGDGDW